MHWAEGRIDVTGDERRRGVRTPPDVVRSRPIASVAGFKGRNVTREGHLEPHVDDKVKERGEKPVVAGEVRVVAVFPGAVMSVEVAKDEKLGVGVR